MKVVKNLPKSTNFNPLDYEPRWLAKWESTDLFGGTADDQSVAEKKKRYLLFAFAYPSGTGLHVGHVESKTALDILARFYRMQGEAVFFPVGWDAFGLPAENYAIKTGIPPVETTQQAIDTFRRQIKRLAISYDWQSEIATCHPGYYRWTQWLFAQLYKKGLAYQGTGMVNWCPSCQTVLANEQVVEGACERCEASVEQKEMRQWFFRITKYQDELISGLDQVDWPEPTKQQQLHWIGRSEGVKIKFEVADTSSTNRIHDHNLVSDVAMFEADFDSNVSLELALQRVQHVSHKWYFSHLHQQKVYAPLLQDYVLVGRSLWNHILEKSRKKSEALFRFFALPKILPLLSSQGAVVTHSIGRDTKKNVEFWTLQGVVDQVIVKVVIRSVDYQPKQVYSVTWKGEMLEVDEIKRELSPVLKQCQGMSTLQLHRENYSTILADLSRMWQEYESKKLAEHDCAKVVECFTTRVDTVFGVTFLAVSPEKLVDWGLLDKIPVKNRRVVNDYLAQVNKKTEEERRIGEKDKTGVDTGLRAINPVNQDEVPIYVADYVLAGYGTGAVMGVPAHDERDRLFAVKHGLPIRRVIDEKEYQVIDLSGEKYQDQYYRHGVSKKNSDIKLKIWGDKKQLTQVDSDYSDYDWTPIDEGATASYGILVNSGDFNGLSSEEALKKIPVAFPEAMVVTTNYKLRDWLISRQRYWGAPIPIIYDPDGLPHLIDDVSLPWTLPTDVDFKPTGESPLVSSVEFQQRTEEYAVSHFANLIEKKGWDKSGQGWRPEYDTMDTFVDSSWYYLRYGDARNEQEFASQAKIERWLPVDFYMIGPEHIVLHLLYSRFFTKFLRDEGYLNFDEPFLKMRHQGMILGPDGKKMSKSKGNVINPDDVIEKFGADTLRLYEMFMGPIEADKPWDVRAVSGVYRFLGRLHGLCMTSLEGISTGKGISGQSSHQDAIHYSTDQEQQSRVVVRKALHNMMKKVTSDIPQLKFNTAIAAMMSFVNVWEESGVGVSGYDLRKLVRVMAPLAPFLAEELYQQLLIVDEKERAGGRASKAQLLVSQKKGDKVVKTQVGRGLQSVHQQVWPSWDEELLVESEIKIVVQVNGKLRGEVLVPAEMIDDKEEVIKLALEQQSIKKWIDQEIIKTIYVVGKILNFVVE